MGSKVARARAFSPEHILTVSFPRVQLHFQIHVGVCFPPFLAVISFGIGHCADFFVHVTGVHVHDTDADKKERERVQADPVMSKP